jgi:hypothetical protein
MELPPLSTGLVHIRGLLNMFFEVLPLASTIETGAESTKSGQRGRRLSKLPGGAGAGPTPVTKQMAFWIRIGPQKGPT